MWYENAGWAVEALVVVGAEVEGGTAGTMDTECAEGVDSVGMDAAAEGGGGTVVEVEAGVKVKMRSMLP